MRKAHYPLSANGTLRALARFSFISHRKRPMATDYARTASYAIAQTEITNLAKAIAPLAASHPGMSGFELLTGGEKSFLRRLDMIRAAERSLDIQYYILENDRTGKLLLEALVDAADRGVRVRILMDALNLRKSDMLWPLLNTHRHIEIRVFNPFTTRDEPLLTCIKELFTGLGHFNRRMHNKAIIVDNQVAIAGGRNWGDSYFEAGSDFNFRDVDILAIGPVVEELSHSFDAYWNDDEAFPYKAIVKPRRVRQDVEKMREGLRTHWQEEMRKGTINLHAPLALQITHTITFLWAEAELAADPPSKVDMQVQDVISRPAQALAKLTQAAQREFIIVSPYFLPGKKGTAELRALVQRGINVRILTNSLASIDAVAAHAGYARYRRALLEGGIGLYETQPVPGTRPHSRRFSSASRNSLHSKTYMIDQRQVVIGSFNLDPRSINLNTETVLIIHSRELAEQVARMFEKAITPKSSFQVRMQEGRLQWFSVEKAEEKYYDSEPKAGFWRGVKARLLAFLPFEDQL